MKKSLILLLVAILSSGIMFAQKKNVISAYNYLNKNKIDKAKEAIDPAIENEKTMADAKTWYYYGNVYLSIQLTEDETFKNLDEFPLDKAYDAYLKALKLDDKNSYTDDVNDRIQVCAEQYFNIGVNAYNEQAYKKASNAFAKSAEVNQTLGRTDSAAFFYAAQSAYFGENFEEAKGYFSILMEMQFDDPGIFRMLSDIYKQEGDTATAIKTINNGRVAFPNDYNLIVDAANIYLATGQNQEALDVLSLAIEQDGSNSTLFFAAGTIYDKMELYDEASGMYKKAIGVDSDYFDANYNLGALYYNRAAEKITEAGNLPLSETEKYDALMADGKKMMENALPYLEKADSIESSDQVTLQTLKEIYTRLNMLDKVKGINERINQ